MSHVAWKWIHAAIDRDVILRMRERGVTISEIARVLGVSRSLVERTIYQNDDC